MNVNDKTGSDPAGQDGSRWMANPFAWAAAATHYTIHAWQRTVLYADIRCQRSNQYREHLQEQQPSVLDAETRAALVGLHPIGRLGHAEEIAHTIAFLLSDGTSFVTGAALVADGGYTAS